MKDWTKDEHGHGCFAVDLDGQKTAFVPSIRDRLIERGVLQCTDGTWYLAMHGYEIDREAGSDMSVCDFCSARPVCWLVPCDNFQMPVVGDLVTWSRGDWAACLVCGTLIDQGHRQALLERAMAVPPPNVKPEDVPKALWKMLRLMKTNVHQSFWQHMKGKPVRIPSHPFGH